MASDLDSGRTATLQLTPQPPMPTVKIQSDETDLGYVIINEFDFDKATMKLYVEPKTKPAAPPAS